MDSVKIVDAALAGDKESFMTAFNAAIADRVSDALEVKKVEIASSLVSPETTETTETTDTEVETNEPTEVETEINGATSDNSSDAV